MNIDHIIPSVLYVTASENINIAEDLAKTPTKTIAELMEEDNNDKKEKKEKEDTQKNKTKD